MSGEAVIIGTFSDAKSIKTRSAYQLVIEIPIEQADEALKALGGIPRPGAEVTVWVARLDPKAVQKAKEPAVQANHHLSRQCATLCTYGKFRTFLKEAAKTVGEPADAEDAASWVRELCQVESRAEFDSDPEAAKRWNALYAEYLVWEKA